MTHYAPPAFWKLHDQLPEHIQRLAKKNFELLKANTHHPSINLKKLSGSGTRSYVSARVGDHYRTVGILDGNDIVWFWIGSHEDYNKLLNRL